MGNAFGHVFVLPLLWAGFSKGNNGNPIILGGALVQDTLILTRGQIPSPFPAQNWISSQR